MDRIQVREKGFYDQYGEKRMALLDPEKSYKVIKETSNFVVVEGETIGGTPVKTMVYRHQIQEDDG
jgi:hypothetical protein